MFELEPKKVHDCKGLIFSGYSNVFWSKGRVEHKQGYRMLKRASCKGCVNCSGMLDYFKDCVSDFGYLEKEEICNYSTYQLFCDGDGEFNFKKISKLGKKVG